MVTPTPFQQALELIERLPVGDQVALIEMVRQRLIEQRRREIAVNAKETLQAFKEGRASYGTLEDLYQDLVDEE